MGLLDKLDKFDETKKETKKGNEKKSRTTRVSKKFVVPEHIKVLFNNLDKSINSVWGIQKDGKVKWDAKYNMWIAFKMWFEEVNK